MRKGLLRLYCLHLPSFCDDGIATGTLSETGMEVKPMAGLSAGFTQQVRPGALVLVWKDRKLVFEEYMNRYAWDGPYYYGERINGTATASI
ncbi:MAG: hypothetical protein R2758_08795 [Bacteroidales bacterium]